MSIAQQFKAEDKVMHDTAKEKGVVLEVYTDGFVLVDMEQRGFVEVKAIYLVKTC